MPSLAARPPVVVHVIPAIGQGGAERLLSDIVGRAAGRARHRILALTDTPASFPFPGAEVSHLGLSRGRLSPAAWPRAAAALARLRPDVVHGWLFHGNLFASLAPRRGAPLIWSIHNTTLPAAWSRLTLGVKRASALLSGWVPWRIAYCAAEARQLHEAMGYARAPGLVLENGVDFAGFAFTPERRAAPRRAARRLGGGRAPAGGGLRRAVRPAEGPCRPGPRLCPGCPGQCGAGAGRRRLHP